MNLRHGLVKGLSFCLIVAAVLGGASGASAAENGSKAAAERSERIMDRLLAEATPAQLKRLAAMPRDEAGTVTPDQIDVPPSLNPTDTAATRRLMRFVENNSGFLANAIAAQRQAGGPEFTKRYVEERIDGVGLGQRGANGLIRTRLPDGSFTYTHGIEAPHGNAAEVSLPTTEWPTDCVTSGRRIKVVIATTPDYTPTWTDVDIVWHAVMRANMKLIWESLRSSHMERLATMKAECNGPSAGILANVPKIHFVKAANLEGNTVYNAVHGQLGSPAGVDAVRYLVFAKRSTPSNGGLGYSSGLSSKTYDWKDEASFSNWNSSSTTAIVYEDGWETHTVLHELLHTVGAVNYQSDSMFPTGGGHCYVAYSVMCYDDNRPPSSTSPNGDLYPVTLCPDDTPDGVSMDCLYMSYFRTSHENNPLFPPVNYLEERRNTAGAENRFFNYSPAWDYDGRCDLDAVCPPGTSP